MTRVALTEVVLKGVSPPAFDQGAVVYVYKRGTTTKATLFVNQVGSSLAAQPLTVNSGGQVVSQAGERVWIEAGRYDIVIGAETTPIELAVGGAEGEGGGGGGSLEVIHAADENAERGEAEVAMWIVNGFTPKEAIEGVDIVIDEAGLTIANIEGLTAALAAKQPLDSDLTAVAALTTTSFGRALLELANAAAGRTAFGLGTIATKAEGEYQPVDSDLTAIAALSTTEYGRSVLTQANAAALRTLAGLGTAAVEAATAFQASDSDLTAIAALTTTEYGRSLLTAANAAAARTTLGLGTAAVEAASAFQPSDSDLTSIAALTTTSYGRELLTMANAAALRTAAGLGTAATEPATAFQPKDADLTAISELTTDSFGRTLLTKTTAKAVREYIEAAAVGEGGGGGGITEGEAIELIESLAQPLDADLTAIAALTTAEAGRKLLEKTSVANIRTYLELGTAALKAEGDFQPKDSDLTAIAELSTTSTGRALLAKSSLAEIRTYLELGTAALKAEGDFQPSDADLTAIAALTTDAVGRALLTKTSIEQLREYLELAAKYQPLDADLTSIAALTTTSSGRELLTLTISAFIKELLEQTSAANARSKLGLGTMATEAAASFQPIDSDLTALAALTTNSVGRELLVKTSLAAIREYLELPTLFQPLDSDLTSIAALTTTSGGRALLTLTTPNVRIHPFVVNYQPAAAELLAWFRVPVSSNETAKLIRMDLKTKAGTVKVKVKRTTSGGSESEPLKEKEAKTELTEHTPTSETLADKDLLEVSSEGAGTGLLLAELYVEYVKT